MNKDKNQSPYIIHIYGLSNKVHKLDFDVEDSFFNAFESSFVKRGVFKVNVSLDRADTMITLSVHINGVAKLECDRSLEEFDFPIDVEERVIYKYGESYEEVDDTLFVIPFGAESIDLSAIIYDLISVEIPMKKLHPKFQDEEESEDELEMVYSSDDFEEDEGEQSPEENQIIDPRWSKLKDLNNK